MVYQLSTNNYNCDDKTDLEELQALRATFPELNDPSYSHNLNYFEMYQLVLDFINAYEQTNTLTDDEKITKIWLEEVVRVNQGEDEQSDFIRNYNLAQKELRYDESITDLELNQTSDQIALDVIQTIIDEDRLVEISILAGQDVREVSDNYLNSNDAAWAGNPLFVAFANRFQHTLS